MSASRIVAANVRRLRKANGWTQMEAATQLAEIGGPTWGNANWSAMERTIDGTRMRSFSADDLVWLSKLFGVPIGDLFEDVPMIPCPNCNGVGEVAS